MGAGLVLLLLAGGPFLSAGLRGSPGAGRIGVIFFTDDVSGLSPAAVEVELLRTFRDLGIPLTFGVIPFASAGGWSRPGAQDMVPLTAEKIETMKEAIRAGVLEISLHGFSHQNVAAGPDREGTEFRGLDYESQAKKIAAGKAFLEKKLETCVSIWSPTWNSYDGTTLRALRDLGFVSLFAMEHGAADPGSTLKYVPVTCDLAHMRAAVESARQTADDRPLIVVWISPADFIRTSRDNGKPTERQFSELMAWIVSQPDVQVLSVGQETRTDDDLGAGRFAAYNSTLGLLHYLYPVLPARFVGRWFSPGVYISAATSARIRTRLWLSALLFYAAIWALSAVAAYIGGLRVFPASRVAAALFRFGGPLLLAVISVYAFQKLDFSYNRTLLEIAQFTARSYYPITAAWTVCSAVSVGAWASYLKLDKRPRSKRAA